MRSAFEENKKKIKFEKENVHFIYDKIASHFNVTRIYSSKKIIEYINKLENGSIICDVGCGNGRNLNLRKDCFCIGVDINISLIKSNKDYINKNIIISDNLLLFIKSNSIDSVLSISVIHHFSSYLRRLEAIKEIIRILKINGSCLIYVWAYEQSKFKDLKQDALIPWKEQKTNIVFNRYYYLFKKNELENMIYDNIKNVDIIEKGIEFNNYYIIIKKIN